MGAYIAKSDGYPRTFDYTPGSGQAVTGSYLSPPRENAGSLFVILSLRNKVGSNYRGSTACVIEVILSRLNAVRILTASIFKVFSWHGLLFSHICLGLQSGSSYKKSCSCA
jgi:hypothetical protein